jgi:hypothetical protein
MHIAGMILGCLLLGQASDAPNATQNRVQPPEMVAKAMQLPTGITVSGQPVTLVNALSSTMDRRQQLEITRTYWRLAQAVAEYHYCLDHAHTLEQIPASRGETASLRLARASAAAMVRQTELEATSAQCDLASLMRLPAGSALPLPLDRPHVGAYRTNYQELFTGRKPPEPLALVDRVLPIRRQAIDDQASAVRAAEDVLATAGDNADVAAECSRELLRQQRTFIRLVCDYNRNIAEYGLAVAGPMTSPQALVAMLIGPAQQGVAGQASANGSVAAPAQQSERGELRTGWRTGQPTPAPQGTRPLKNEPTLAPPRDDRRSADIQEPNFAPKDEGVRTVGNEEPAPARGILQPMGKTEPTLAPPRGKTFDEPVDIKDKPMVPIQSSEAPPMPKKQTAKKPVMGGERGEDNNTVGATLLYPALVDATPAVRAKQLTVALNWDRTLPKGIGKPMSLADCVTRDPGTDRRATIAAYWQLRRRAAEYQALSQQAEFLEELAPIALDHRGKPSGASEMLRLHAAQLATQAAVHEAQAGLVEAQYAFALRIGAVSDAVWPLASTVPHAGSYLLNLEAQSRAVAESWPVRRLAVSIPQMSQSIREHASAVVEADAARVAAAEQYRMGAASIDPAIDSILVQTEQTVAVLVALTDYNRAIADYVLTVMPPTTPLNQLVAALVVKP